MKDYIPEAVDGIICTIHGKQGLSMMEALQQRRRGQWSCPLRDCTGQATFDHERAKEKK